jgi:hypothetical protein
MLPTALGVTPPVASVGDIPLKEGDKSLRVPGVSTDLPPSYTPQLLSAVVPNLSTKTCYEYFGVSGAKPLGKMTPSPIRGEGVWG